jgi:hypothetical protein
MRLTIPGDAGIPKSDRMLLVTALLGYLQVDDLVDGIRAHCITILGLVRILMKSRLALPANVAGKGIQHNPAFDSSSERSLFGAWQE